MHNRNENLILEINQNYNALEGRLRELENVISHLLKNIGNANNFTETEIYFSELLKLFEGTGRIIFNSNYNVKKDILKIFKEYDRIDDTDERRRIYKSLKKGKNT